MSKFGNFQANLVEFRVPKVISGCNSVPIRLSTVDNSIH